MSQFRLRYFCRREVLNQISPPRLLLFLRPFEDYLRSRGIILPAESLEPAHYELLAQTFQTPDSRTPQAMIEGLYLCDQVTGVPLLDDLLEMAEELELDLPEDDQTQADLALALWMHNRDLVERQYGWKLLSRRRSFEYYCCTELPAPILAKLSPQLLAELQHQLDQWFLQQRRGPGTQVFHYQVESNDWFLIRHGGPLQRESTIQGASSQTLVFHPEKFDVVVYEPAYGLLRINASTKSERTLYRQQFGKVLFGDSGFFPGTLKYTLEPLRGWRPEILNCRDVPGLESVLLTEVHFDFVQARGKCLMLRAQDILADFPDVPERLSEKTKIVQARFEMKHRGWPQPRSVVIRNYNCAQFTRDDDSTVVEQWLSRRGFSLTSSGENDENTDPLLGSARHRLASGNGP